MLRAPMAGKSRGSSLTNQPKRRFLKLSVEPALYFATTRLNIRNCNPTAWKRIFHGNAPHTPTRISINRQSIPGVPESVLTFEINREKEVQRFRGSKVSTTFTHLRIRASSSSYIGVIWVIYGSFPAEFLRYPTRLGENSEYLHSFYGK